jgi:hypothetical protein
VQVVEVHGRDRGRGRHGWGGPRVVVSRAASAGGGVRGRIRRQRWRIVRHDDDGDGRMVVMRYALHTHTLSSRWYVCGCRVEFTVVAVTSVDETTPETIIPVTSTCTTRVTSVRVAQSNASRYVDRTLIIVCARALYACIC